MNVGPKIVASIGVVVITVILLAMTPVVVEQVQSALWEAESGTDPWNFTGYSGAMSILGLVPFIWVASVLVAAAVGMFAITKEHD